MIKKLAWNTFKNTGNINTFLELLEVENTEKTLLNNEVGSTINNADNFTNILASNSQIDIVDNTATNTQTNIKKDIYGNNQNEGNSTFRK